MKIKWLGHSAFHLETASAKILIDPFFTGNPSFDESSRKDAAAGLTQRLKQVVTGRQRDAQSCQIIMNQ